MKTTTPLKSHRGRFLPLPSTVTRERGTVSKADALDIIDELTARFETRRPKLEWRNVRGGTYFVNGEAISFGPNSYRGVDVLLHEFAHHLQKTEKYKALAPEGYVVERWDYRWGERVQSYRRSIHGPDFFAALLDVAAFAYSDHHHYSWDWEYKAIAKKYQRQFGETTGQALRRQERRVPMVPFRTWDFGTVAAVAAPNGDGRAAKHAAWARLRKAIVKAGGTLPPKGRGTNDALRTTATFLGLNHLIPNGRMTR